MVYPDSLEPEDRRYAEALLNALHDVNMRAGYNEGMSAHQSVEAERAGISSEI